MRYTVYNPELHKYEVPLLTKLDGDPIQLIIRHEVGESFTDAKGVVVYQDRGIDYVSGEIIDRLAQLENMVEKEANP